MTGDDHTVYNAIESQFSHTKSYCPGATWMTIDGDGGGVFVIMHGGSRRVGPSSEAVTVRRDEKMYGVD